MATWDDVPVELKFQIVNYLVDDATEEIKPYCQVQRPHPRFYYANYAPKYNPKEFEVHWTSRSGVIATGLYSLVKADPKMVEVVEHICQQRQLLPRRALTDARAAQQLVINKPQAPWKMCIEFLWIPAGESLMRKIAILHHLSVLGRIRMIPEEPGEIAEDAYLFLMR